MRSIYHILNNLTPSHREEIRQSLEEESKFNEYAVNIFDAYVQGLNEQEVRSSLKLSRRNFKTFERSIEKIIYQYYDIEDQTFHDLIFSSIFYSVYASTEKNQSARCEELEDLYHNMKQMQIDQAATPLLLELKTIAWNTPLETVYDHLYQKHLIIENDLIDMLNLLTLVNSNLELIKLEDSFELAKNRCFKLMERMNDLYNKNQNNTAETILKIAKLNLFVFSNGQMMMNEDEVDDSLADIEFLLKKLPLGIERFYLKNIFAQIKMIYLYQSNDQISLKKIIQNSDYKKSIEAYNFNFPNHLTDEIIEANLAEKYKGNVTANKLYFLGPNNGLNQNFERVSN